ncbi:acetate kinase [Streptococcus sp. X13SY08]|uniref:acetate kinase n=1 Tax=Streptococcus sp. X13SY08 TaxID=1676616 RepID=UPI00066FDF6E|nr:acetate kinase [Streptococcus sp. X13SY08]
MSKTIAINAGSSSLKWQLYNMPQEEVLAAGIIERIGLKDSISTVKFDGNKEVETLDIADHVQAVKIVLDDLLKHGIINDYNEIIGVGHRVVAGGEDFKESVVIDDEALAKIEKLSALAPLHNPANAAGIRAFKDILPDITSVAVFDTAFHTTMEDYTYLYPIPQKYYTDNQVRKYGAHGTSHFYVAHEAAKMLERPIEELKLITAHIAIIPYLVEHADDLDDAAAVVNMLNKQSGLAGVSGVSSDMRDILSGVEKGAALAYKMFVDRIKKFIGQYVAVLNGVDAIIFTAGMGENAADMRRDVIAGLSWFGMEVDPEKNVFGYVGDISTPESTVKVLVIPTDEELVIAREVERLKK